MKKKLVHNFIWQGLLVCSLLVGCTDLSHTDVTTDGDTETVIIEEGFTYTDLYKLLNPEVHSLEALRGQWIHMGLDEETIDKIINDHNGWEGQ